MVVQADGLGTGLAQVIIAMVTGNLSRAGHPSRVLVQISTGEGRRSGLLSDSVVMTDNLATVLLGDILRSIGELPMPSVDAALRNTLAL